MARELVAFVVVAGVLSAAAACGPPASSVADTNSPQAQATNVRRTEVAEVQRIIFNNPTATLAALPTPTGSPTCQAAGAIWWHEARAHVGESRTVQGTVIGSRPVAGGLALLEVGQPYPDPTGLAVLLPATAGSTLTGKTVCVAGQLVSLEGRPTIQLRGTTGLQVLN